MLDVREKLASIARPKSAVDTMRQRLQDEAMSRATKQVEKIIGQMKIEEELVSVINRIKDEAISEIRSELRKASDEVRQMVSDVRMNVGSARVAAGSAITGLKSQVDSYVKDKVSDTQTRIGNIQNHSFNSYIENTFKRINERQSAAVSAIDEVSKKHSQALSIAYDKIMDKVKAKTPKEDTAPVVPDKTGEPSHFINEGSKMSPIETAKDIENIGERKGDARKLLY